MIQTLTPIQESEMKKARKGIYAAAITPLAADGTPDLQKLAAYCQRILAVGLTGVAPAGTTGEGVSMPMRSRLAMPAQFAKAGIEGDRVIFGTGACATEDAIAVTRASCEVGYNTALVLPPFYFKTVSEDGLYAHFARLIDGVASDDLRLYLYHFPQMTMTPISVSLIARLKSGFGPIIAGLKDSSGDYAGTKAFVEAVPDFDVFPSNEGVLLQGQKDGCAGVVSATVNALPELAGSVLTGRNAAEQSRLAELRSLISDFPLSAALKQIETWKSGDKSWTAVLPPLVPLTPDQQSSLRDAVTLYSERTGHRVI